jgi:hypothetical protein
MAAQKHGYAYSNQLHSIIWELHRRLGRAYKSKENAVASKALWEDYENGKLSQVDVLRGIIRLAEQSGVKLKAK